jgi:uncharacterized protein (TIGR03435 family)
MKRQFTYEPCRRNKAVFASRAVLTVAELLLIGLPVHSIAQTSAGAPASGKSGPTNLSFEVASVKRSDPSHRGFGQPLTCSLGRCVAQGISLAALAMNAYDTKEAYQIEWADPWMASELYEIAAKVPDGAKMEQVHIMLQRLLSERFGLVVHRETRQLRGFRLAVATGGEKLTKSLDVSASADSGREIVTKDGTPHYSSNAKSGMLLTLAVQILHGHHENMTGLVHQLAVALHAPVIDATGLKGEYDYDLSFAPEIAPVSKGSAVFVAPVPSAASGQANPALPSDRPTIFAAIKQQLRLQLEAHKSVPVEVLVLDKASRIPTEN